jgi:hypothetical protein
MTTTQWIIALIISFLGGGAVGAIINQAVTSYKNRRQPIGYKLEVLEIFDKTKVYGTKAVITIEAEERSDGRVALIVETLSVARLRLVNQGNQDIPEFLFGVSLGENEAFRYKETTQDKHHKVVCLTPPSPNPTGLKTELDFKLMPFNRNEEYYIDIYFTYDVPPPDKITLSTPHPVRFVEIGAKAEFAKKSGKEILKGIGRKFLPIP